MDALRETPGSRASPAASRAPRSFLSDVFRLKAAGPGWTALLLIILITLILISAHFVAAWPTDLPPGVSVSAVASGFAAWITDIEFISARHSLVLTKQGKIYLLDNFYFDLSMRSKPLIDLQSSVSPAQGDRGLVSVAVHPDFRKNGKRGYIYVGYVDDTSKECQDLGRLCDIKWNRIRRYRLVFNEATQWFDIVQDKIVFGACTKALMIEGWYGQDCSPMVGTTHSLGSIWFGPDKKLWAAVGEGQLLDGSFWTEKWKNFAKLDRALSMDVNFLGGKILRMEANTADGILRGLKDNPFYDGSVRKARSMVWAVGLRNPWRCTHNSASKTPEVLCGVVGHFSFESAVKIRKGSNLGWPCYEGKTPTPGGNTEVPACKRIYAEGAQALGYPAINLDLVMFVYDHGGVSAAAIGGIVLPPYFGKGWAGRFLVTDYVRSTIWAVNPADSSVKIFAQGGDNIVSMKINPFDGSIYLVLICQTCTSKGYIRRIDVAGRPIRTIATRRATTARPVVPRTTAAPINPLCSPPNRIRLVPLPMESTGQKWETVMYLSKTGFPLSRITATQNGGWGPIGWDSSVGPRPYSASNGSRVLSIGREFFTSGLGTKGFSQIKVDLGGINRCWKVVAKVGIDDEIHLGGEKTAWGEFQVTAGLETTAKVLYSSSAERAKRGLPPLKARDAPYEVVVTNLTEITSFVLRAARPEPIATYAFDSVWAHYDWTSVRLYCGPDAPYLPVVEILTPVGAAEYAIGDTVRFSARAWYWDRTTQITDPSAFSWNIVLVHCQGYLCHTHSELEGVTGTSGMFTVKDHAPDSQQYYFYEIVVVVTDGCRRSDKATKTVKVRGYSGE